MSIRYSVVYWMNGVWAVVDTADDDRIVSVWSSNAAACASALAATRAWLAEKV